MAAGQRLPCSEPRFSQRFPPGYAGYTKLFGAGFNPMTNIMIMTA